MKPSEEGVERRKGNRESFEVRRRCQIAKMISIKLLPQNQKQKVNNERLDGGEGQKNKKGSSSSWYMQQVPPGCLIWYSDKSVGEAQAAQIQAGCGKYSTMGQIIYLQFKSAFYSLTSQ